MNWLDENGIVVIDRPLTWFKSHSVRLICASKARLSRQSEHRFGDWQWGNCPQGTFGCLESVGRSLKVDRYKNNERVDRKHGKPRRGGYKKYENIVFISGGSSYLVYIYVKSSYTILRLPSNLEMVEYRRDRTLFDCCDMGPSSQPPLDN